MRSSTFVLALMFGSAAGAYAQDGNAVIKQMHARYAGKWYNTLTFVQTTTMTRPDGTRDTATWYEAVKGPDRLRIDIRSPADGNGILYTADSSVIVRNGAAVRTRPDGNPFLPLIMGAYLQSPEKTAAQLTRFGFDLSKTTKSTWEGEPVVIVGTDSPTDSASAQFWIDDRQLLVRFWSRAEGESDALDIRVGGYEKIGDAWLATKIAIMSGATVVQDEQYADWKTNVELADALFDPAQWKTAPHWAK